MSQRKSGASAGRYEVFIIGPSGKRFRSRNELKSFFEKTGENTLNPDDFDFSTFGRNNPIKVRLYFANKHSFLFLSFLIRLRRNNCILIFICLTMSKEGNVTFLVCMYIETILRADYAPRYNLFPGKALADKRLRLRDCGQTRQTGPADLISAVLTDFCEPMTNIFI